MVPFAGWDMPVQYAGVIEEHRAVREDVGIFDVSHMGQIETRGPGAMSFLQHLTTNDISRIEVGGAQYGLLIEEGGGVLDDLFTYRLGDEAFLTVTNASNHSSDLSRWQQEAAAFDVEIVDLAPATAMLAVQGPRAREIVGANADSPLPERMRAGRVTLWGADVLVCGTGYTGEDGVEILCAPDQAGEIWDGVVSAGAVPCGLGARDTLRIEAGYHLYGNDLDTTRNPVEAGLAWACDTDGGYVGADAVAAARSTGTPERLVAFVMTDPGVARAGNPIVGGGTVSSGTFGPTLGVGLGMAFVPAAKAAPGTGIEIDVRGKLRAAEVRDRPLYRKAD